MLTCFLTGSSPCSICSRTARWSFEDGPGLEERLDPERTEFTPHAGVFESAKRRLLIVKHAVDCYAACKEKGGYAACALCVTPADISVKAVVRVVCDFNRIFVIVVTDDTQ